jgi:hypothetical protein
VSRKIVQIQVIKEKEHNPQIVGLADDGTVWIASFNSYTGEIFGEGWVPIQMPMSSTPTKE